MGPRDFLQQLWRFRQTGSWGTGWVRLLLAGAAALYEGGARIRRNLYQQGWREKKFLPAAVLSVGNLVVGGTGKTPLTAWLARLCQERGLKVAILSRGYGGRRRAVTCVSDGERIWRQPPEVGEEAYLLARLLPGVVLYTGRSRYEAGLAAWKAHRPDVFLLDDGFQHFQLERDLDLVLLDAGEPFGNGRLLPAGPLREPADTLKEADGLILSRYDPGVHADRQVFFGQRFPEQKVFTADLLPVAVQSYPAGELLEVEKLRGMPVLAFAGLARPEVFRRTLVSLGARLCGFRAYPDHYFFRPADLKTLEEEARQTGAAVLVTTAKDWARLGEIWRGALPLWVLKVEARLEPEAPFQELLAAALASPGKIPAAAGRSSPAKFPPGPQPLPPLVRRRFRRLQVTGQPPPETSRVKRILLRAPNWLGDAVMSLSLLEGLAALFPQARITVLAVPRVAPLFAGQPGVDHIVPYPAGREKWRTLLSLRGKFELALALPNSLEAAAGLFLTRTPCRVGYAADGRSPFLTTVLKGRRSLRGLHQVFYYLGLLKAFGEVRICHPPRLRLPEESGAGTCQRLGLKGRSGSALWVGLAPGASYGPAKRWPAERFAAAARILSREFHAGTVILGGPEDQECAAEIHRMAGDRCLNLTGKTSLPEALALLNRLQVLISNDSGLMHAAAALGVPVVALFGSTSPQATGPFSPKAAVLYHPQPCAPCFRRTCKTGYACLRAISVEEVVEAARPWLSVTSHPQDDGVEREES